MIELGLSLYTVYTTNFVSELQFQLMINDEKLKY